MVYNNIVRVLIACEFSGIVKTAFQQKGHETWSCDLLPSEKGSLYHLQYDVKQVLDHNWDMMVAFPPCTYLCSSGARWWKDRQEEQSNALAFFTTLLTANIPLIAIENPIGIVSSKIRKPDQIIQPWMFGHGETKATCLWLKGLPKLTPTNIVEGRFPKVHRLPPSPLRWMERSRTYPGIAQAMADQWSNI